MIGLLYPSISMGSFIDDRSFRGPLADVIATYHAVHKFDKAAGHKLQDSKSIITSTCAVERQAIQQMELNGLKPSCPDFFILVGNIITTLHKRFAAPANCNLAKATRSAMRLQRASVSNGRKAFAFGCAVIPRAIANTQWDLLSFPAMGSLRTIVRGGV